MRDFLLLRGHPADGTMLTVRVRDGVAEGRFALRADLAQAKEIAMREALDIVILIPGTLAVVHKIELPVRGHRAARAAAAFALEERIAAPVETQHVALSSADGTGRRRAAVIDRAHMLSITASLRASGLRPAALMPDHAALRPEPGEALALADGGLFLVALDGGESFAIEPGLFRHIAPALLEQAGIARLGWHEGDGSALLPDDALPAGIAIERAKGDAADLFASGIAAQPPMTLLEGDYDLRPGWRARLAPFRHAAALAALALPLHAGLVALEGLGDRKAVQALDDLIAQRMHEALPNTRRIVNPVAQMDAAIASASARGGDFLLLAGHAFETAAMRAGVEIDTMRYDGQRGSLDLALQFSDIGDLATMTERLRSNAILVREGAIRSEGGRYSGALSLELPR